MFKQRGVRCAEHTERRRQFDFKAHEGAEGRNRGLPRERPHLQGCLRPTQRPAPPRKVSGAVLCGRGIAEMGSLGPSWATFTPSPERGPENQRGSFRNKHIRRNRESHKKASTGFRTCKSSETPSLGASPPGENLRNLFKIMENFTMNESGET